MTTPAATASDAEFQQLLEKTRNAHERAGRKIDESVAKMNTAIESVPDILLPDWAKGFVKDAIAEIYGLFRKLSNELAKFFSSPGWPGALWAVGDTWRDSVAKPCADTENRVNAAHMHVDDYWKGSAAESYKGALPKQQAAFAAMTQVARKLHQACSDAGWNIISLWGGIAVAVLGLAATVAGFVASATGVGAIVGVPTVVAGIVGCIAGVAGVVWTITQGFHAISKTVSSLRDEVELNTSFHGDQWPAATATGAWKAD